MGVRIWIHRDHGQSRSTFLKLRYWGDSMTKEAKILGLAALAAIAFFAFNSLKNEYTRIQSRVEVTQAKVDALADELASTTKTVHAAIKSLTDRFLADEEREIGLVNEASPVRADIVKADILKAELEKLNDVNRLSERTSSVPTIIMHSGYSCGPCNAWLSNEMPRWLQSGWKIEVVKEIDSVRAWPWYEITDRDGKQFEVNGPLTNNNFNAARAGVK